MAFGFIGDIVEGIGDVLLPKGTRGSTIGSAVGSYFGPAGSAVGSKIGASVSSQLSGKSAVSTPTINQAAAGASETGLSGVGTGPITQQDYANLARGREIITGGFPTVYRPQVGASVAEGAVGAVMDLIPDINITKYFGGSQVCATRPSGAPVTIKADGCITVSRKQQQRLKVMVQTIGLPAVADALGLSEGEVAALLLKNFPRRGKGISAAQLRNAKRVNRTIMGMAKQLQDACKSPVTRRRK